MRRSNLAAKRLKAVRISVGLSGGKGSQMTRATDIDALHDPFPGAAGVMAEAEDVLAAVREYVDHDLPLYTECLRAAFREVEPIFARKRYSEFFWHCASTVPGWLPEVVLANAEVESAGSAKLLSLWQGVDYNTEVEAAVLGHAEDESRHSRVFLKLARHAFPRTIDTSLVEEMARTLPDVRGKQHVKSPTRINEVTLIDHLVQMNIGEIRTRLHMHLLAPTVAAFTPEETKPKVELILTSLVRDEVRHIGYTARLMEVWANSGAATLVRTLYAQRLRDFDVITFEQTAPAVRSYGQGRFPTLLEL
jgi:hypothetical protein